MGAHPSPPPGGPWGLLAEFASAVRRDFRSKSAAVGFNPEISITRSHR